MIQIIQQIFGTSPLEQVAVLVSLAAIWLGTRQMIATWPLDILGSALYALVFLHTRLYSDAILQLIFIVMSIYGWISWTKPRKANAVLVVRNITLSEIVICASISIFYTFLGGYLLSHYTQASQPYTDSFCTALSISATWLAAHKVLENWTIWIFTDCIYVALFVNKHLYPTAILYFVLVLLAVSGLFSWKKSQSLNTYGHS